MTAAWVAGSVRAGALPNRRLGTAAVRQLAATGSLPSAVDALAVSSCARYVHSGDSLAAAQRGVAESLLWNLRVLAGWVPADGVRTLRLLAGWFELSNIDDHVRFLVDGAPAEPPYRLGALATAWPRLASTNSLPGLRAELSHSAWGDPGGGDPRQVSLALRLVWADRICAGVPAAQPWAMGAVALLLARENVAMGRMSASAAAAAARVLGRGWAPGASLRDLAERLPPTAGWALRGVSDPAELWRAELRWWARLYRDGTALLANPRFGVGRLLGAVAVLAVDAWQVRAALEVAARGGPDAVAAEVLDALA